MVIVPQVISAEQATTIDELAQMYNIEACADCHEEIYDEWKGSWHSQSLTDSRVIRTWRTFILSGLDQKGLPRSTLKNICLVCHAPQIKYATDEVAARIADLIVTAADDPDVAKREAAVKELSKINVNCLICHNMKAVPGGQAQAKTIYSIRDDIDTEPHKEEIGFDTIKSEYLTKAKFCSECHHGCPPGMPSTICPTLWTSYQEHYIAHGGTKICQDCHMQQGEDHKMHNFPGITDIEFAKTGIDLILHASPTQYAYHLENKIVPAVIINVQVKNISGHGIPHG